MDSSELPLSSALFAFCLRSRVACVLLIDFSSDFPPFFSMELSHSSADMCVKLALTFITLPLAELWSSPVMLASSPAMVESSHMVEVSSPPLLSVVVYLATKITVTLRTGLDVDIYSYL